MLVLGARFELCAHVHAALEVADIVLELGARLKLGAHMRAAVEEVNLVHVLRLEEAGLLEHMVCAAQMLEHVAACSHSP